MTGGLIQVSVSSTGLRLCCWVSLGGSWPLLSDQSPTGGPCCLVAGFTSFGQTWEVETSLLHLQVSSPPSRHSLWSSIPFSVRDSPRAHHRNDPERSCSQSPPDFSPHLLRSPYSSKRNHHPTRNNEQFRNPHCQVCSKLDSSCSGLSYTSTHWPLPSWPDSVHLVLFHSAPACLALSLPTPSQPSPF